MNVPAGVVNQPQINAAIRTVLKELSPWVRHIRYDIAQDWTGQWAIFFRVLLTDEASKEKNLRAIAPRIVWRMSDELDIPNLGMLPHFNFRSESEQAELKDPAWV